MPGLSYDLLSLRLIADADNCYTGTSEGIALNWSESGVELFSRRIWQLNGLYGHRTDQPNEKAHAVIAPGAIPSPRIVNMNDFHCFHGHSDEVLLRKIAKSIGVKFEGELESCNGCSQAKGSHNPIKS